MEEGKIVYDMTAIWYSDDDALEDIITVSALDREENERAFQAPAFCRSWGRGGDRPSVFNIVIPQV